MAILVQGKQFSVRTIVSSPSRQNQGMTAATTVADGDQATATTLAATPVATSNAQGAGIKVRVNGISYTPGDGTKVAVACYFSGDGGTTPRAYQNIVAGDKCYWNGTVAGFQLDTTTDLVDFVYQVGPS